MKYLKGSLKVIAHYWYVCLFVGSFLLVAIALRLLGKPNCPIYHLFNYPCPACGITRAWIAFFSGKIALSFTYHPLFWLIPVIVILFLLRKVPQLKRLYYKNFVWVTIIIIFLLAYLVRVIIAYPEPFIA
ncbi:MAG: DUF2752 domain-containing protein [Bacilli bacterium]|jgi:hypothetical protein|nr:DUF2752 domain-containing protein [Bacilli bacterium]HHU24476.1 DUF2752 domain-containing protein [Acholeplasmataceae bacterium]